MDSKFVESKHKLALKKTLFNVLTTKKFRHNYFFNVCARPHTIKNFNKELRFRPKFVIIRFVDIS